MAMAADSRVRQQELASEAAIESAKIQADATKAAAKAQAGASQMGSIFGAIGSIAGAFSDETTKHDINPIDNALGKLRELKPVTFYYNEEYSSSPERMHHGFIAQEYQKVMPDATYFDESTQKLCIDTSDLIGLLVRAVQQLEGRLSHMEACQALAGVK